MPLDDLGPAGKSPISLLFVRADNLHVADYTPGAGEEAGFPYHLFARRPRVEHLLDTRCVFFVELQPSLAQSIHLPLTPSCLHHPIRHVPGAWKKVAQPDRSNLRQILATARQFKS